MNQFFRIANFEKYQHYKDRKPPWIKLYREVLSEPKFFALTDAERYYLIGLFILASQHDNRLPYNDEWLKVELKTTKQIPVAKLLQLGWVEWCETASVPVSIPASKKPIVETETEGQRQNTEAEGIAAKHEKRASHAIDSAAEMFKEAWNLKRAPDVYEWHSGDFPQLAKLRKRLGLNGSTPPDWERAITNYFATRQKAHTLADLAVNYGVFVNEALDRFGKPIGGEYAEPESSEQGKARRTREASEQLLARRFESTGGFLPH